MNSVAKRALGGSGILLLAVMLVNVLNYGYALILGRTLGPAAYGAYASFVALFLILSLWPLTLQQVAARFAATGSSVRGLLVPLAWKSGTALGLLLLLLAVPLSRVLMLPAPWLIGLAVLMPLFGLTGVLRGEAQGEARFLPFGTNLVIEHLGKIVLTPLALLLTPGAAGAVLATLAAFPLTALHLRRTDAARPVTPAERLTALKFARPAFANLAAQALIMNSDVLLVRAFLPSREAGLYAAVSIIGRVVFYGAWAVSTALFPLVAARRSGHAGQLLWLSLGLTGAVSGGVTLVCALAPTLIVNLLFGAAYLPGAYILAPYALITTLYALSNAVINHSLALDRSRNAYLIAVIAALQVTLMLLHHATVQAILLDQLIGQSLLLLISLLMLRTPQPVSPEESYVLH
ncbi:hypothetical protein MF271_20335 (plasmid) [Deinococcus sp. KNUC1210]|uniref:oligosaccharide flippase family protein n=1 Tax=Deinococcus sp. KNUC1210 TaxID=2917691 RepID=UPI001EF08741|nr:oligosaccharide flippase family protein [Deinococcus sp. KNUC1210]ULH17758.1 hypothetical protein MF271_20335 [Deinococcus sp. KNUC1210]